MEGVKAILLSCSLIILSLYLLLVKNWSTVSVLPRLIK